MLGRQIEPGSTILVGRKAGEEGAVDGDEVDITFIPGDVTPEKVTVPPEEPVSSEEEPVTED